MFFNAFKDLLQLEPGQSKGGQFLEDCVQGAPLVTHNDKSPARRIPCWQWQGACTTECKGTLAFCSRLFFLIHFRSNIKFKFQPRWGLHSWGVRESTTACLHRRSWTMLLYTTTSWSHMLPESKTIRLTPDVLLIVAMLDWVYTKNMCRVALHCKYI